MYREFFEKGSRVLSIISKFQKDANFHGGNVDSAKRDSWYALRGKEKLGVVKLDVTPV